MDEAMKKLVDILGYEQDPQYQRILKPMLDDVTIDTLDKALTNRDTVIDKMIRDSSAARFPYTYFGNLLSKGIIEKTNGGFHVLEPFILEGGMESQTVKVGYKPVHFGKGAKVTRSTFDAQTYLDEGSTVQYSLFPDNSRSNFVGPKSIVSEAIIRGCVISGDKNGEDRGTYAHPQMLLNTFVGNGAQISFPTNSFSHPLNDDNAYFVNPLDWRTFNTGRRMNPSFIGSQKDFNGHMRRSKVGAGVVLNNPCVVGSGYAVKNLKDFYGIGLLDIDENNINVKNVVPVYGTQPISA
jgi:hypothetical protein